MRFLKKEKNRCTYFVSWIVADVEPMQIGNATILSSETGRDLFMEVVNAIQKELPNAIVLNIVKLD